MSGEIKTIKLNETLKLSFKQNAKGLWYFTEVTIQLNPMDEETKDIVVEQINQWRNVMEKNGCVFAKGGATPEVVETKNNDQIQ